jgi:uncharacterized protein (DUF1697 family)
MNAKMPDLKRAVEAAGFAEVKTLLASGNVTFEAPEASSEALEKKVEAAMRKQLGVSFLTIVRSIDELRRLIESDPFAGVKMKPNSKQVVTFLRRPPAEPKFPLEQDDARVLKLEGNNLFTVYVPNAKGPVFMTLIERAVGKEQTTRTWQTVQKVVGS